MFASKIATIQGYKALLLCASNWEIFSAVVQLEKSLLFCFCNFTMLQKQEKSLHLSLKLHLHGRLCCNAIRRFLMRENLSRTVVTHTRRDSLTAIAFGKNRRRVSNTCDLRCRSYFARLDARVLLARDHLHEVDFNVSRVSGQSRARVNSKSYAIYESPRHSAMHKCFASRWQRLR